MGIAPQFAESSDLMSTFCSLEKPAAFNASDSRAIVQAGDL